MRKVLLLLFVMSIGLHINASEVDSIQFRNGKVIIEEVITVPNATASQLYGKAKLFFSKTFNFAKRVIDSEDPENHTIVGKGKIVSQEDQGYGGIYYNFTILIQTKDGRYRYTITDMYVEMTGLAPMTITAEHSAKVAKEKDSMEPIKDYYEKTAPIITTLKEQMHINEDEDEW